MKRRIVLGALAGVLMMGLTAGAYAQGPVRQDDGKGIGIEQQMNRDKGKKPIQKPGEHDRRPDIGQDRPHECHKGQANHMGKKPQGFPPHEQGNKGNARR